MLNARLNELLDGYRNAVTLDISDPSLPESQLVSLALDQQSNIAVWHDDGSGSSIHGLPVLRRCNFIPPAVLWV
jgi:hypothetical protein